MEYLPESIWQQPSSPTRTQLDRLGLALGEPEPPGRPSSCIESPSHIREPSLPTSRRQIISQRELGAQIKETVDARREGQSVGELRYRPQTPIEPLVYEGGVKRGYAVERYPGFAKCNQARNGVAYVLIINNTIVLLCRLKGMCIV